MAETLTEKLKRKQQALMMKGKEKEPQESANANNPPPPPRKQPPPKQDTGQISNGAQLMSAQVRQSNIDVSVQFIDLNLIDVEDQVRTVFDSEYIADLACDFAISESLQPNQPVTLWRRSNGRFLLDDGENRYRAMRYASDHREELGVNNLDAFTQIRATIKGDEPGKLTRIQSQAKANLLRDSLNDYEIANAAMLYREEKPAASTTEIAEWIGFKNSNSGRVKVTQAMQVFDCDDDILLDVKKGKYGARKALELQKERSREAKEQNSKPAAENASQSKSEKKLAQAKEKTKNTSISLPIDSLKNGLVVIKALAEKSGVAFDLNIEKLDRKSIVKAYEELNHLIDPVK